MRRSVILFLILLPVLLTACQGTPGKIEWLSDPLPYPESAKTQHIPWVPNTVDVSRLVSSNGQPLIQPKIEKVVPARPADPLALPLQDPLHWYDLEFIGWNTLKKDLPVSPKDGAEGKHVVMVVGDDHPYWISTAIGAKKVADAYGMTFQMYNSRQTPEDQRRIVNRAIAAQPDLILVAAIDISHSEEVFQRIYDRGIPIIAFNTLPSNEAWQYILAWSGPDDWTQQRLLANALAERMGGEGGICYLTHFEGGSAYYSRLYGPISELTNRYPGITHLDSVSAGYQAETCREAVLDWCESYGQRMTAVYCADDYFQITGVIEALQQSGREDVIIVAAGNSHNGMEAIKSGAVHAITYQSGELDGASAVQLAADWFNGLRIPYRSYIRHDLITAENVDQFMPV